MARTGHGSGHHDWLSRDYLDIDCQAIGCNFNREKKCAVPSRCKIASDGRCEGFLAKPTLPKGGGD